ncbi:MAG: hypothetical protein ACK5PB_21190 [Pirellula sp.]|jgi:hypothetical protein
MTTKNILADAAYLFDFGFSIRRFDVTSSKSGRIDDLSWSLSNIYSLPRLEQLSTDKVRDWTMRGAWHERGLMFEMEVERISAARIVEGQPYHRALQLYIDTRASLGIKRGNHFCYRLNFPTQQPPEKIADRILMGRNTSIHKCTEDPPKVPDEDLLFQVVPQHDTSELWRVFIRGNKLHGYNPAEFPEIGFFFCMYDTQSSSIHLARTASSRFQEDPSNWCRVKLI